MSWLRLHRRRLLRWGLFGLALAGLAWGLYVVLPPEPRWVVRGSIVQMGFTHDGKALITATMNTADLPNKNRSPAFPRVEPMTGPVEFLDLATGQPVWSVLGDNGPRWQVEVADDRTRLAAIAPLFEGAEQDELRIFDLKTGGERRATIDHQLSPFHLEFAPGGALLLLYSDALLLHPEFRQRKEHCLYDTASLHCVGKVPQRDYWPQWHWSADGTALVTCTTDERGNTLLRRLTANGEKIVPLTGAGEWLNTTPDGKTLITELPRPGADDSAPMDSILLWDAATGARRGAIAVDGFDPRGAGDPTTFTPDSRTLLVRMGRHQPGKVLGVWDLVAARWLAKIPLADTGAPYFPSPDSLVVRNLQSKVRVAWYQLRPFARLWEHTEPNADMAAVDYLPGLDRQLVVSVTKERQRLRLLDPRTGAPTFDLALDAVDSHHWLARGESFAVVTWHRDDERSAFWRFIEEHVIAQLMPNYQRGDVMPTTTQFFDTATGNEWCRIDHAGADPIDITPDGNGLIMYQQAGPDGEAAIICYDIPPRRPWRFIFGIPVVLGATLLLARIGWRCVRHPCEPPASAGGGRSSSEGGRSSAGESGPPPANAGGSQA